MKLPEGAEVPPDSAVTIFSELLQPVLDGLAIPPDALREKYRVERDKRLRPDGIGQYTEVAREFAHYVEDPWAGGPAQRRAPVDEQVDVTIVGGGLGGLVAAARLRERGCRSLRIVEKASGFGGTWYWNRYPGIMCDVESYVYLPLLEEIGYVPRQKYSLGEEIRSHADAIAAHYDLGGSALLRTAVTGMAWAEDDRRWRVTTDRGDELRSRFVIIANGSLTRPKLPRIPGIGEFGGHTFHTSRWDYGYTGGGPGGGMTGLADKRVGIVGTGATGVQVVPRVAEDAAELYVFQRTPSVVGFRGNRTTDPVWAAGLTPGWQTRRMDNFIRLVSGMNQDTDLVDDGWTAMFGDMTGRAMKPFSQALGRRLTADERQAVTEAYDMRTMENIRARIETIVEDPATAEALKPWYRAFCKRPTFHDEYLQAFNRPNVHLVDTDGKGIERVTAHGVIAGGRETELDCLIFATGYELGTAFTANIGYDVVGANGLRLRDKWANGLRTFHGLHAHGFPNMFFMGRVQTGGSVNYTHTVDGQAKHLAHLLEDLGRRGVRRVEAAPEAEQEWQDILAAGSRADREFQLECTPGYFNNEGQPNSEHNYSANAYGPGPVKFFALLEAWREQGTLAGLQLDVTAGEAVPGGR